MYATFTLISEESGSYDESDDADRNNSGPEEQLFVIRRS